ncbi:unnamed protein product [Moneuplotes crassus]|uniref:RRM domain-containing protein n=1 Tax=Euplotes crassus TaxID=5936 RepID=A0AAD1UMT5_EUPCR|nr:unnamed protein product [Moneuplotes crassus]
MNSQPVNPDATSLWMGEIEPWMDETQIANLFAHVAKVMSVKIIKNKMTGLPAGYGFVEFESNEVARKVKDQLNGTPIPELNKTFRLNWATQSTGLPRTLTQNTPSMGPAPSVGGGDNSGDFSVYVGDLDPNVTDSILLEHFSNSYKSILSANVIVDSITKRSKKFGFVRFSSQEESQRAIAEMNGQYLLTRPMKLNVGYKKSTQQSQPSSYGGGNGGAGPSSYGGGYGHAPPPSYPPAYPQYNDPYGSNNQSYGYGSYPYNNSDPYGSSSQYGYGSYGYGQPSTGSNYYGSSSGGYPPAPSGSYDYGQTSGSYPQYPASNGYGDTSTSGYPPKASQSSYGADTSTGYQSYYNNYPQTSSYDYGINSAQAPPVEETPPSAPIQASKEIDYDLGEEEMGRIFDDEKTSSANEEYFNHLVESKGTVDLLF